MAKSKLHTTSITVHVYPNSAGTLHFLSTISPSPKKLRNPHPFSSVKQGPSNRERKHATALRPVFADLIVGLLCYNTRHSHLLPIVKGEKHSIDIAMATQTLYRPRKSDSDSEKGNEESCLSPGVHVLSMCDPEDAERDSPYGRPDRVNDTVQCCSPSPCAPCLGRERTPTLSPAACCPPRTPAHRCVARGQ